jgi:hypothetical protein
VFIGTHDGELPPERLRDTREIAKVRFLDCSARQPMAMSGRLPTWGRADVNDHFGPLLARKRPFWIRPRPPKAECHAPCSPPGQWWPEEKKAMGHSEYDPAAKERRPWNAGRVVGAKRALKPQQVWAIRFWLNRERRLRDRAMFDLAIDSKLRG